MTRGFTLLELLVVISIMGLLATVVVTSIAPSRNKAYDAKAKATITQLKIEVDLIGNPVGMCSNSKIAAMVQSASGSCQISGAVWNIYLPLKYPPVGTEGLCLDSAGTQMFLTLAQFNCRVYCGTTGPCML